MVVVITVQTRRNRRVKESGVRMTRRAGRRWLPSGIAAGALVISSAGIAMAAVAPSAPQSAAVISAVDGAFTVQWAAPASSGDNPIQTYAVTSSSTVTGATQGSCSAPVDGTSCVVSGLDNGIAYTFSVTAFNRLTSPAATTAAISSQGKPTRPRDVAVTPGDGFADVAWSGPLSDGGAVVNKYAVSTSPSSPGCTTLGDPDRSCRLPGLTIGQQYTVTVTATNSYGTSIASDGVLTVPLRKTTKPLNVTATAGNASASVQWDPPADIGGSAIVSYRVETSPASSGCTTAAGTTTCNVTGLVNGTSYSVTVHATNAAGESVGSDAVMVTPRTVPDQPADLAVTAGDGNALVNWNAPDFNGGSNIVGYLVSTSPASAGCQTYVGVSPNPTQCTVTGLANGTSYQVSVLAYNVAGDSVRTAPVAVIPRTNPAAPINLTAVPGNGNATVNWTAPAFDGGRALISYQVTASPGGATCSATAPDTNCVLTGLTNGVQYALTVTATNSDQLQSTASTATVVSPLTIPTAPLNVSTYRGVNSAMVGWMAPASNGGRAISLYTVTAQPGGATCTSLQTACTVGGLTPGVDYSFTVVAANPAGTGPASDPVVQQVLNVPSAVRQVKVVAAGTTQSQLGKADVSWKAPVNSGGSPIVGYYVRSGSTGTAVCYTTTKTSCRLKGLVVSPSQITVESVNSQGSGPRTNASVKVPLTTFSSNYAGWRTQRFSGVGLLPNKKINILHQQSNGEYVVARTFRYSSGRHWQVKVAVPSGQSAWKVQVSGYTSPSIVVNR